MGEGGSDARHGWARPREEKGARDGRRGDGHDDSRRAWRARRGRGIGTCGRRGGREGTRTTTERGRGGRGEAGTGLRGGLDRLAVLVRADLDQSYQHPWKAMAWRGGWCVVRWARTWMIIANKPGRPPPGEGGRSGGGRLGGKGEHAGVAGGEGVPRAFLPASLRMARLPLAMLSGRGSHLND